ncbi:MAG: hypothetical protein Q8K99_02335 [Actinomycetota bacterium]|nr:hypothetical protein [Actinomycetota bacterium]
MIDERIPFDDVEVLDWTDDADVPDEPIRVPDGAALLEELHVALGRYVAFPSCEAHDAMTAWIAATHAQRA